MQNYWIYVITIKYEKLNVLIQSGEENCMIMTRVSTLFNTFIIDGRLPIKNEENLGTFENDLSNDKSFRYQLVCHI